jgi:hypothetical protein
MCVNIYFNYLGLYLASSLPGDSGQVPGAAGEPPEEAGTQTARGEATRAAYRSRREPPHGSLPGPDGTHRVRLPLSAARRCGAHRGTYPCCESRRVCGRVGWYWLSRPGHQSRCKLRRTQLCKGDNFGLTKFLRFIIMYSSGVI